MSYSMEEVLEIWKPVVGYEGHYEVSNLGRVRSVDKEVFVKNNCKAIKKGKVRSLKTTKYGYKEVNLSKGNEAKSKRVNRLVAEAFLPNPDNLPCVNHKNEDKLDNRVENLEWCDVRYNTIYGNGIKKQLETKVRKGIIDESHIGLSRKEVYSLTRKNL